MHKPRGPVARLTSPRVFSVSGWRPQARPALVAERGWARHSTWWSRAWMLDPLDSKAGELFPFSVPRVLTYNQGDASTHPGGQRRHAYSG